MGSRLMPATLYCKKPFLPIYNNGIIEPAIYILLRELETCNYIEEIYLIINKNDNYNFKSKKIRYIIQEEPEGLEDAILKCKEYIGHEYFILCLGDMIYKSKNISCVQQLIDCFNTNFKSIIGLKKIKKENISINGMVKGKKKKNIIYIENFFEKPNLDFAIKNNIKYGTFGNYILNDKFLDLLKYKTFGEALEHIAEEGNFIGLLIDGKSFDIGTPKNYYLAFKNYSK